MIEMTDKVKKEIKKIPLWRRKVLRKAQDSSKQTLAEIPWFAVYREEELSKNDRVREKPTMGCIYVYVSEEWLKHNLTPREFASYIAEKMLCGGTPEK